MNIDKLRIFAKNPEGFENDPLRGFDINLTINDQPVHSIKSIQFKAEAGSKPVEVLIEAYILDEVDIFFKDNFETKVVPVDRPAISNDLGYRIPIRHENAITKEYVFEQTIEAFDYPSKSFQPIKDLCFTESYFGEGFTDNQCKEKAYSKAQNHSKFLPNNLATHLKIIHTFTEK